MLKLATVFSGIGAIEHALERMGIPFEIVFACDNGDIDIFSKKVPNDLSVINIELIKLTDIIESNNALNKLDELKKKYKILQQLTDSLYESTFVLDIIYIFDYLISSDIKLSAALLKEYNSKKVYNDRSKFSNYLFLVKKINNLVSKNIFLKKENTVFTKKLYDCNAFIDNEEINSYIKMVKDLSERISMLYEEVESEKVKKEINKKDTHLEKKEYIDELYKPYKKQNKVMQSYFANYNLKDDDFYWNVSFLDGKLYNKQVDLFVGGSPCQSFSLVGKQRGLEDTRGTLFYEFARLVNEIKPKIFIYENVKAVLSNDNGKTWDVMTTVFDDLKYKFYPMILNAKDYGIPQNRERLFVIGFREDIGLVGNYITPKKTTLNKTMKDFLIDNVSGKYYLNKKGVSFVTDEKNINKRYTQIDGKIQLCQKRNQQFNWHGDFVFVEENKNKEKLMKDLEKYFLSEKVVKYVLSTGTKGFYSKPKVNLDVARPLLTSMHKMHRAGVDNYVTTDGRLRKLTPRECLRLMGFCDSFQIVVSDTAMYQQAGNSIVVDVLMAIMTSALKVYPALVEGEDKNDSKNQNI